MYSCGWYDGQRGIFGKSSGVDIVRLHPAFAFSRCLNTKAPRSPISIPRYSLLFDIESSLNITLNLQALLAANKTSLKDGGPLLLLTNNLQSQVISTLSELSQHVNLTFYSGKLVQIGISLRNKELASRN